MKFIQLHFTAIILLLILMGCHYQKTPLSGDQNALFDSLLVETYDIYLELHPSYATYLGDYRNNDTLAVFISQSHRNHLRRYYTKLQNDLKKIDNSALSVDNKIYYDIIGREAEIRLEELEFNKHYIPFDQTSGFHLIMAQFASGNFAQPFNCVQDYYHWISRARDFCSYLDTAISNMRQGIESNYTLPKSLVKKLIPQFSAFSDKPLQEHVYYLPILNMPDSFAESDQRALKAEYSRLILDDIIPAHQRVKEFLEKEYLPAARETAGIGALPNGKELYRLNIKSYTTTSLAPDDIFELGIKEVERITGEVEKIKEELGYLGSNREFFNHIKNLEELMPFKESKEVLANFEEIYQRMEPKLKELFNLKPKTPFEIRQIEKYREASTGPHYFRGSLEANKPGIFYVPIPDASKYHTLWDEALFLHEAIPGHHYQLSLANENKAVPKIMNIISNSGYVEGWGLYTESLGKELGLYQDPYQYLGMLNLDLHRAIRLVVDVGLHARGWTREEAIQYCLDHEAQKKETIVQEVERYMAMPGQALSYKIGQLKILELRDKAEKALQEKFDIAEFHTVILEKGAMPLHMLETRVNKWIEESNDLVM